MKKKIVIFISGRGTNALNIISEFRDSDKISVIKVYSNNENSPFLRGQNNLKTNISYFSNGHANS